MIIPIAALVFLSVFCLLVAAGVSLIERHSSPKTELKRRLQRMAGQKGSEVPEELRAAVSKGANRADLFLARFPLTRNLAATLEHAGIQARGVTFVALTASAALVAVTLTVLQSGILLLGMLVAAAVVLLAALFLKGKAQRRKARFTEHFPDALSIISRSLRAGHSFTTAVQLVGQEIPAPVGPLFRAAYDQQQLGLRMTDALVGMNQKIKSLDMRFFTTAVAINSDVGGNLSDVLDKLALTIRDRLRIRRQVQVYTAQGRLSGYVLGALPVVVFGMFSVMNPEYESALLKEPLGRYVLLFAALMQVAGLMIIARIIRIRI